MRRQCIRVMKHGCDGQVFATHRAIDDDLQTFDGAERIDCAPIATGSVVIEDQRHQTGSSVCFAAAAFSSLRL